MKPDDNRGWKTAGVVAFLLVTGYIMVSWNYFVLRHTKAGSGAFFVHFKEVVLFRDVPELQEKKR